MAIEIVHDSKFLMNVIIIFLINLVNKWIPIEDTLESVEGYPLEDLRIIRIWTLLLWNDGNWLITHVQNWLNRFYSIKFAL